MKIHWNAESAHHGLRAGILLGFLILILRLLATGDMLLYIAPHLLIYVEFAAAGLSLLAAFQAYIAVVSLRRPAVLCDCGHDHDHEHDHDRVLEHGHDHSHEHDHDHSHEHDHGHGLDGHSHELPRSIGKLAFIYGLFLLPLLLGAIVPNSALAGTLAQNKGMNLGGAGWKGGGAPGDLVELEGEADPDVKRLFKTSVYNKDYAKLGVLLYRQDEIEMKDEWFIEKLQAMNMFVDNFHGKRIRITGFVYRESGLAATQFIVGRMAMTHCIADVSPYGIIAESADAARYANDAWITVSGTIDETSFQERKVIRIDVDSVQPAKAPGVPYVYPDWNFASKI
ncbi:TIGR03943 family putative permease subunit [Cohnella nanjingensis]|uniref:TIGR03943 family protein n=1 Tax=Cohnella nanjingensis TaxID=1387779 RepID=A0A7X0VCN5_9BACL|nr:TIGR03943 family protein [Cohnella nanjingensis]MBB6669112.1 TIGR03943 family protein [Cohnella nanjingensis]